MTYPHIVIGHFFHQLTFEFTGTPRRKKDLFSLDPAQFDKRSKKGSCQLVLAKYDRGALKDVYKIVTADVSWICAYELETKQQSTMWVFKPQPNLTKIVCGRSTSKEVIASFCCLRSDCSTRVFF